MDPMGIAYSMRDFDRFKVSKLFVVGIVRVHTMERMNRMFVRQTGERIERKWYTGGGFKLNDFYSYPYQVIQSDLSIP